MDAQQFLNCLRIMHSLDEVSSVLPAEKVSAFHSNPLSAAIRMDEQTWASVYALILARQKPRELLCKACGEEVDEHGKTKSAAAGCYYCVVGCEVCGHGDCDSSC